MGWFSITKKKETALEIPELWAQCPSCEAMVYKQEWEQNIKVCPKCGFHDRLTCFERIGLLIDSGTFTKMDDDIVASDPLEFVDGAGPYARKAKATQKKTGLSEAVISGTGKIGGTDVAIAVMDFRFFGGSLGSGTGEIILRTTNRALRQKMPCLIISASGGARMQEGMVSLMQMAKTCAGIANLNKAGVPYLSLLTHPTMGGVSASFAMMGDINIAEPGATIGFAGKRVIEQTINQKLPEGFQTSEYLLEHGFIDLIVERKHLKTEIARILKYATTRGAAGSKRLAKQGKA